MKLKGARILITGASRGIGEATARELGRRGARLALAARTAPALEELAQELRADDVEVHILLVDVSDEIQVRKMVADAERAMGEIDVLINNAGLGLSAPVKDIKPDDLRYVFEVNVMAAHVATIAALPKMLRRKSGHIVNVGSVASHIAFPSLGGYSASKFALKALSDALRMELRGKGVGVSLICPGPIKTDFITNVKGRAAGNLPTKPVGTSVEDAARCIVNAIRRNQAEAFVPAYYQAMVGAHAVAPQFMRMFGAEGVKITTELAERFL